MNDQRPAPYVEAHSAVNGPLLALGLLPPFGVIVCLTLGIAANLPGLFGVTGALFALTLISVGLLYRNWPTGIRVDESGIGIGAIRSTRAAGRRPTVNHQSWGVFSCPWPAVQDARIVTDPAELRHLKTASRYYTLTNRWGSKTGMTHCNIGVLTSPLMRAALVIEIDPSDATATETRPARYYSNFKDGRFSHLIQPRLSPTWIAPTRHPEALRAALQAIPDNTGRNL